MKSNQGTNNLKEGDLEIIVGEGGPGVVDVLHEANGGDLFADNHCDPLVGGGGSIVSKPQHLMNRVLDDSDEVLVRVAKQIVHIPREFLRQTDREESANCTEQRRKWTSSSSS
jgi:hypothetical protein